MAAAPTGPSFDLDTRQLRDLNRDLRRLRNNKPALRRYAKASRTVAEREMIPALRSKVQSLPSQNQSARAGMKSLREAAAKSLVVSVKVGDDYVGSWIRSNPKKMTPRKRFSGFLPSYMEGIPGFTTWRHPNWGDPGPWSRQPATPWMQEVIARHTPGFVREVQSEFEQATAQAVQGRRSR
jgi:hypothetical protein